VKLYKYIALSLGISVFIVFTAGLSAQEKASGKTTKSCGCPFDNVKVDGSFYDEPLYTAEVTPSFPGGETALKKYMNRLIQNPAKNLHDSTTYQVYCLFVVEKNGTISHPKILRQSDSIFNAEALRFVATMPRWNPGKIDGETVRCWHGITIYFGYPENK
jgi:hypothetical protein